MSETMLEILKITLPSLFTILLGAVTITWNHANKKKSYFTKSMDTFFKRANTYVKKTESEMNIDNKKKNILNTFDSTVLTSMIIELKKSGTTIIVEKAHYYTRPNMCEKRKRNSTLADLLTSFREEIQSTTNALDLRENIATFRQKVFHTIKGINY